MYYFHNLPLTKKDGFSSKDSKFAGGVSSLALFE